MSENIFEAFNARDLLPNEVAESFVLSSNFYQLAGRSHVVVIGPRGSGKTTLLKMLSVEALRSWSHTEADTVRNLINFTGVFVPADVTWGAMVGCLGGAGISAECKAILGDTAFCINVQMALINTMINRRKSTSSSTDSNYRAVSTIINIDGLVKEIAENWELKLNSLSLKGIYDGLQNRLSNLYAESKVFSFNDSLTPSEIFSTCPYTKIDVIQSILFAIKAFDETFNEVDNKWAILLDEFEVVPEHIQKTILSALRATSPKIIYKIALAPCGPHATLQSDALLVPSLLDDYSRIMLWHKEKKDVINFCGELLNRKSLTHCESPHDLLGKSQLLEYEDSNQEDYDLLSDVPKPSVWSSLWEVPFKSLAKKDSTFAKFLHDKKIDVNNLNPNDSENGSTIRKVAPIVLFRNHYRTEEGNIQGKRPFYRPYYGWESIATITEGNPRWFIGLIKYLQNKNDSNIATRPIGDEVQRQAIEYITEAFQEKLKTVAIESNNGITTSKSVFSFLEIIGERFRDILIRDSFLEDPQASFSVDKNISKDDEDCLRIAMNFGGIVCYDNPDNVGGYSTLQNKRFRLAFTLHPLFKLPLRSGRKLALSTMLKTNTLPKSTGSNPDNNQTELFNE